MAATFAALRPVTADKPVYNYLIPPFNGTEAWFILVDSPIASAMYAIGDVQFGQTMEELTFVDEYILSEPLHHFSYFPLLVQHTRDDRMTG